MGDDRPTLERRLTELEQDNRLLRQQTRQAERLRHMWQQSAAELKRARAELLEAKSQLSEANAELQVRLDELEQAKGQLERLAYSDQQIIDNMQEGVIVTDAGGLITAVNPAFEQATGYSGDEVLGQNPRVLKSGRHDEGFYRALWATLLRDGCWQGEIWNRRKDGEVYPELLSITAIRDWRGEPINYVGVFTDITERKRMEDALRTSKARLDAVTSALSEAVLMLDEQERVVFANPEAVRIIGRSVADMDCADVHELLRVVEPRGRFLLPPAFTVHDFIDSDEGVMFDDVHLVDGQGQTLSVALSSSPIIKGRDIVGAVVAFHDIRRRKEAEEQLRKLSRAIEHSPSMVVITDLQGHIEYVNPRFSEITGYAAEEVIGRPISLLKSGNTPAEVYGDLWHTLLAGEDWHGELQNRRKDGTLFWQMVSISPIIDREGAITHFVSVEEDITERKNAEEKVWRQANFDSLTGLPNRRLFQDRLEQAVGRSVRSSNGGALLFLDLDRFKYVNDTLGHESGDRLLQQFAERLEGCVRRSDTVARLGGDEFTVILPEIGGIEDVEAVARKVLGEAARPFTVSGDEIYVSTSIGVTLFPADGQTVDALLKYADAAMYRAKDSGRDTFCYYTAAINDELMRKMALEVELRRALERDELHLEYQPIVDAASGEATGIEALLRWRSGRYGTVPPGQFIAIAESAGLMPGIGAWVLDRAMDEAMALARSCGHRLYLSVNLSVPQLKSPAFVEELRRLLTAHRFDPQLLVLEITESVVMSEAEYYLRVLKQLTDLGLRLAIDDFGTGYSSLSYLKRLNASTLKIDQSFVADLPDDPDDATIVTTIIGMAHNLGMQVIAEGVETEAQYRFLQRARCDYIQGFYFRRPAALGDLSAGCPEA